MSDATPTPEQQSAFRRMDDYAKNTWGGQMLDDWEDLVAALPDALTNPQPALPTEPGMYVSHTDKHGAWLLHGDGDWWPPFQDYSVPLSEVQAAAPFTRLVPERPQVTREQVVNAITENYPYGAVDFENDIADRILALVNGTRA